MYDSRVGRWWSVDPMQSSYSSFSPYNYTLNSPINYIDVEGKWVDVRRKEREGRNDKVIISYSGVILDNTGTLNKSQIRKYKRSIIRDLRRTYKGQGESIDWKMGRVKIRVINSIDQRVLNDNVIRLEDNSGGPYSTLSGNGSAPHGLLARVGIYKRLEDGSLVNRSSEEIARTAGHEVGHNAGLPHIIWDNEMVKNPQYRVILPKTEEKPQQDVSIEGRFGFGTTKKSEFNFTLNIIPEFIQKRLKANIIGVNHEVADNRMVQGTQTNIPRSKITEAQILHIEQDFNAPRLNNVGESGGDTKWGEYETDTPVYNTDGEKVEK